MKQELSMGRKERKVNLVSQVWLGKVVHQVIQANQVVEEIRVHKARKVCRYARFVLENSIKCSQIRVINTSLKL